MESLSPGSVHSFKERADAFFKAGNFEDAAILYLKAESDSPKYHVLPSNLSAALFELGDYGGCFDAICRSWRLFSIADNLALALRLSVRLAKALCQGSRRSTDGHFTDKISQNVEIINSAEAVAIQNGASDAKRVWHEYRLILKEPVDAASRARQRFCELPKFRKSSLSDLEYFPVGMDDVISLFDNWGPLIFSSEKSPLKLNELPTSQLSNLSFLLGGVGDARHVYGTLIGGRKAYEDLTKAKQSKFHLHITLLDIHPGILARDLCIMMLVDSLRDCDANSLAATEIRATLFYAYISPVMPAYCHDKLQQIITLLMGRLSNTPPQLPNWLHVDINAIPGILDTLSYWSTIGPDIMTVRKIQGIHVHESPSTAYKSSVEDAIASKALKQDIEHNYRKLRKEVADYYDSASAAKRKCLTIGWAQLGKQGAAKVRQDREQMIEGMFLTRLDKNEPARMLHEKLWYDITGAFIPPKALWNRHAGFETSSIIKDTEEPIPLDMQRKLKKHVESTWKPNPTLIDRKHMKLTENRGERHPRDVFDTLRVIRDFLFQHSLDSYVDPSGKPSDAPAFSHVSAFFDEVVKSLIVLNDRVQLEMLCGELTQELSRMAIGSNSIMMRPQGFPRMYSRAYLSNVPDYTHGPVNTIVHSLPIIQSGSQFGVASTCLLNSVVWSNTDEFFYTYALLRPDDIPRYLNCELIRKDNAFRDLIVFGNSVPTRPLSKLASKQELFGWLSRVLVCTLVPGSINSKFDVHLPNNIVAFFALLRHLPIIGYPSHWIAEFVQNLVDDNVVTDTCIYRGTLPISPSDHIPQRTSMRKIRLHPWVAEVETILAISHQGFLFSMSLSTGFGKRPEDIGIFEVAVTPRFPLVLLLNRNPVVSLLIYTLTPGEDNTGTKIVQILPDVLDGIEPQPILDPYFVLTSLEVADLVGGKIRFRLSKNRVRKMVAQRVWFLVAFRSDVGIPITLPVAASNWKTIDTLSP